jgi:hypothetical protein
VYKRPKQIRTQGNRRFRRNAALLPKPQHMP